MSLNPQSLADVFADIERIGDAARVPERGTRYTAELRQRVDRVRHAASRITGSQQPRVAVIEWIEPLMIAGNWTPELVALAGGKYALAEAGRHRTYTSWSAVHEYAPEVIIVVAVRLRREANKARNAHPGACARLARSAGGKSRPHPRLRRQRFSIAAGRGWWTRWNTFAPSSHP